jgi:hypothetical protein
VIAGAILDQAGGRSGGKPVQSGAEGAGGGSARRGDTRTALWLGIFLFALYLLTTSGRRPYGDEAEYLAVAENLAGGGAPAAARVETDAGGRERTVMAFSKFPPGQSVLLLPFAALGRAARAVAPASLSFLPNLIVNALPALEAAAICALLFLLARLIGAAVPELALSRTAAAALALSAGIATQLWPASRTLFADTSAALFLTYAIYALVRFARAGGQDRWLVAASWSVALMVWCKTIFLLAGPALLGYGYWAFRTHRDTAPDRASRTMPPLVFMAAVPLVLAAGMQLGYNHLRYGSPWSFGYHEGRDGEFGFSTPFWVGLFGIFLSPGRSVFLYSPICLLALSGTRRFFRLAKPETALLAGVTAPVVFAYATWWSWHGGWEWGTRFYLFLIPVLLLLSIPAWRWLDEPLPAAARRARAAALAILVAAALGVQSLGLLIHPGAYWLLSARELATFRQPVYQNGVWEIRDDMLLPHFVPEFSPIAAHAWLAWATWNQKRLDDGALAAAAPWASLNPRWAPKDVRPYLGYDLWFLGTWPISAVVLTALPLVAMLAMAARRLADLLPGGSRQGSAGGG